MNTHATDLPRSTPVHAWKRGRFSLGGYSRYFLSFSRALPWLLAVALLGPDLADVRHQGPEASAPSPESGASVRGSVWHTGLLVPMGASFDRRGATPRTDKTWREILAHLHLSMVSGIGFISPMMQKIPKSSSLTGPEWWLFLGRSARDPEIGVRRVRSIVDYRLSIIERAQCLPNPVDAPRIWPEAMACGDPMREGNLYRVPN